MENKQYHFLVPQTTQEHLRRAFGNVKTVNDLLEAFQNLPSPIDSVLVKSLAVLTNPGLCDEDGNPKKKLIKAVRRQNRLPDTFQLPIQMSDVCTAEIITAIRLAVRNSLEFNTARDDIAVKRTARENGYGDAPYACVLFSLDVLSERALAS